MVIFFYVIYSCLGVFGMLRNAVNVATLLGTVYSESFFWKALPVVAASAKVIAGPVLRVDLPDRALQDLCGFVRSKLVTLKCSRCWPSLDGRSAGGRTSRWPWIATCEVST